MKQFKSTRLWLVVILTLEFIDLLHFVDKTITIAVMPFFLPVYGGAVLWYFHSREHERTLELKRDA